MNTNDVRRIVKNALEKKISIAESCEAEGYSYNTLAKKHWKEACRLLATYIDKHIASHKQQLG